MSNKRSPLHLLPLHPPPLPRPPPPLGSNPHVPQHSTVDLCTIVVTDGSCGLFHIIETDQSKPVNENNVYVPLITTPLVPPFLPLPLPSLSPFPPSPLTSGLSRCGLVHWFTVRCSHLTGLCVPLLLLVFVWVQSSQ